MGGGGSKAVKAAVKEGKKTGRVMLVQEPLQDGLLPKKILKLGDALVSLTLDDNPGLGKSCARTKVSTAYLFP